MLGFAPNKVDFACYERHWGRTPLSFAMLYAYILRAQGLLDLKSLQINPARERLGPFALLNRSQCSVCLQTHVGGVCPIRLVLQNPGTSLADAEAAIFEGQNRYKKAEYRAAQLARELAQSFPSEVKAAPEVKAPPAKAPYGRRERERREGYQAARLNKQTARGVAYEPCRLHSRMGQAAQLGLASDRDDGCPDTDLRNPRAMEWRRTRNPGTGYYEWTRQCRCDSRCQRTILNRSGPPPRVDQFAEEIFRIQELERHARPQDRDRNVIYYSDDWQPHGNQ